MHYCNNCAVCDPAHASAVASRYKIKPQIGYKIKPQSDVCRFYGAVSYTLCATLWDPGSSINMITPAFADELSKRKGLLTLRWSYCDPVEVVHGSGEGCTAAAPAVRRLVADLVLCQCKGLLGSRRMLSFIFMKPAYLMSSCPVSC